MVKMASNGVPGAVGQGRCALLSGLEVPRVNRARQIRQGFSGGSPGELGGSCLDAVAAGLQGATAVGCAHGGCLVDLEGGAAVVQEGSGLA